MATNMGSFSANAVVNVLKTSVNQSGFPNLLERTSHQAPSLELAMLGSRGSWPSPA